MRETLLRTRLTNFHIPAKRTPPRAVSRAGCDTVEIIFEFETAFGPCQRNMWKRTAQPGLWFTAGSLAQCRIFSRTLAIQIKALEEGLLN